MLALTVGPGFGTSWLPMAAILVVTPLVWWWFAAHQSSITPGVGAVAGAVIGALAAPLVIALSLLIPEGSHDALDVVMLFGTLWLVIIPPAIALGAGAAALERWMLASRLTRQ